MKFKHIIFDWDGTVMDSVPKIVSCMQLAAKQTAMPIPSDHAVKQIIGISLQPAIQQLFSCAEEVAIDIVEAYKEVFVSQDNTPCPLFANVLPTLQSMQGNAALAVATGKARRGLERAWLNTDTRHFFEHSRCADEAQSKPHPDMLQQILSLWNVPAEQVLMVGDSVHDMAMAEAINMPRIAVSYGAHSSQALQQHAPIAVIDRFEQLLNYID